MCQKNTIVIIIASTREHLQILKNVIVDRSITIIIRFKIIHY